VSYNSLLGKMGLWLLVPHGVTDDRVTKLESNSIFSKLNQMRASKKTSKFSIKNHWEAILMKLDVNRSISTKFYKFMKFLSILNEF
jgi:hypothetical protein